MKKSLIVLAFMVLASCQGAYSWVGKASQHTGQGVSLLLESFGGLWLLLMGSALKDGNVQCIKKVHHGQDEVTYESDATRSTQRGNECVVIGALLLGDTCYKAYTWYFRDRVFPEKCIHPQDSTQEQLIQQKI